MFILLAGAADNDHLLITVESQSSLPIVDSQSLENSHSLAPPTLSFVIENKHFTINENETFLSSKPRNFSDFSSNIVLIKPEIRHSNFTHRTPDNSSSHTPVQHDKNYAKCDANIKNSKNQTTTNR